MNKRDAKRFLCLFVCLMSFFSVWAQRTDSIVNELWREAQYYDKRIGHFESKLYLKRYVRKRGKNILIELVPQMMSFEKGVNEYMSESVSTINYTAPDAYDRKIEYAYGTIPNLKKSSDMVMDYFTINLYKETMINDHLLSPFLSDNRNYYYYQLDSINTREAFVHFVPKYSNTQFVKGSFVLDLENHLVKRTRFEGRYEFMKFEVELRMGEEGLEMYLPKEIDLDYHFKFAGNSIEGRYNAIHDYVHIDQEYNDRRKRKSRFDLTNRYALQLDTTRFLFDSLLIARNRSIPLTMNEQRIYDRYAYRIDSINQNKTFEENPNQSKKSINWGAIGESMVSSYNVNLPLLGKVKSSALLAPMLFHYSKTRGFDFRQELDYQHANKKGNIFGFKPLLGYNLTYHEFDWRISLSYDYWKKIQAHTELEAGNGFRTFNSEIVEKLKKWEDYNLEKLDLSYFNDIHVRISQRIEPLNGFQITVGASWYNRWLSNKKTNNELEDLHLKDHYKTFAPRVRVDWTPGRYYYWDKNQKVTVKSAFPTLSLDWETGLKGFLGSEASYQRYEVEMSKEWHNQQEKRISFKLGYGAFTQHEDDVYFIDFYNFSHNRLADTWDEDLGGTFHLLNYRWYSSANEYFRSHFTYESPNLFIANALKGAAHAIQAERLYFSALIMSQLKPYIEVGYGIATPIVDLGLFGAIKNGKPDAIGVKFSFELFK